MTVMRSAAGADVCVAVVNYNTRELLGRCLRSLTTEGAAEVIVVDNGSADGSVSYVREQFPGVDVIENATNVGYGAAANQAIGRTAAPLVLVLNADTEVRAGCIDALARSAARAPRAGIIAPAIVNRSGVEEPSCFPFPGTLGWLLENEPVAAVARRVPLLRKRAVSFQRHAEERPVPWALGCALLVRRGALDAVGGFDESYFMYYEEVDLSRRLADAGWEVRFTPDARVEHVGGASTSQARTAMLIRHFESTLRYYRRYHSGPRLAFWLTLLHAKRIALLARDSAQLLAETEPAERRRLREQCRAWSASLGLSDRKAAMNGSPRDAGRLAG